jgi:CRP/FNR family cyclic AMP-dependent transcriptional regulator
MQPLEMTLAAHPFFTGLKPHDIHIIAGFATNAYYDSGTFIFKEGEQAAHFYILQEGKVALETFAAERGAIPIETIEAGEVLGWSWLFPPYRWHFSARVVEPTRVIVLDGVRLRARCEEDHDLGYDFVMRVAQIMMQRLQATRLQLIDMYRIKV